MKRLAVPVLVIILLLAIPLQSVLASRLASHEDPALAMPSIDAYSWLAFYGQVISQLTAKQYVDVADLLDELKNADIPDNFKDLLTKFNSLLSDLTDDLGALQATVDQVRLYLDEREPASAAADLQQARELMQRSRGHVAELRQEMGDISSRLGVLSLLGPALGPATEAQRRLEELLTQLESLQDEYDRLLLSLQAETEVLQQLKPSQLTLELSAAQAWVGETITLNGRLVDGEDASPLADRAVSITVDGTEALYLTTDASGAYQGQLQIPYRYVQTMVLQALFAPGPTDAYEGSDSGEQPITVLFVPTQLTLEAAPAQAWLGDTIAVSGRLTSVLDGSPLAGRTVKVTLEGGEAVATTGADGSFTGDLPVPFRYVASLPVRAKYPQEPSSIYHSSSSPAVELALLFYATDVSLETREFYPGWATALEGAVSSESDLPQGDRAVELFLDGERVGAAVTEAGGRFSMEFTPAPGIALGKHEVAVVVAEAGLHAAGSAEMLIDVVALVPEVTVHHPRVVLVPGDIRVQGAVASRLSGVSGARVSILWEGDSVLAVSADDGAFDGSLSTSFGAGIVMFRQIVVLVEPVQPWYQPAQAVSEITLVNLINIGFLSVGLLSVGAVLYARRRMDASRAPGETFSLAADGGDEPLVLAPETRMRLDSMRQRVLAAYVAAVRQAEISAGVRMRPQTTLREYLGEVASLVGPASALDALTGLAEEALYGPRHVTEAQAWRAEELSQAFRELIRDSLPAERSAGGNT